MPPNGHRVNLLKQGHRGRIARALRRRDEKGRSCWKGLLSLANHRTKLFDFCAQRRDCVERRCVLMMTRSLRCILSWESEAARGGTPLRVAIRAAILLQL